MSDKSAVDAYFKARERLIDAREAMFEATVEAFPIGARVISYKFHSGPIRCTVVGHCPDESNLGGLRLSNDQTGKVHTAWPYYTRRDGGPGVELVEED